jgi:hypothetical protein
VIVTGLNKLQNIQRSNKTSFGSVNGETRKVTTSLGDSFMAEGTTFLFRKANKQQIIGLPQILAEKFPNGCPIIVHACSVGHEAYSVAIALKEQLGEKANKFFPLKGLELHSGSVEQANSGFLPIDPLELETLSELKIPTEKYFEKTGDKRGKQNIYRVLDSLRKNITFSVGDFFADAKDSKLFEKPCAFLLHNQLYHHDTGGQNALPVKKLKTFFGDLFGSMKPKSLFFTDGRWDTNSHYPGLIESGFRPLSDRSGALFEVYEKPL